LAHCHRPLHVKYKKDLVLFTIVNFGLLLNTTLLLVLISPPLLRALTSLILALLRFIFLPLSLLRTTFTLLLTIRRRRAEPIALKVIPTTLPIVAASVVVPTTSGAIAAIAAVASASGAGV
jgi:hypothetical protein